MKLWIADIRELVDREAECMALLTAGRKQRAERHLMQEERLLQAAAGLLLRRVLNVQSDDDLRQNVYGKPTLAAGGPEFSLSHGGTYAVLAVHDGVVGVDVEPVSPREFGVSSRFLHPEEREWLEQDPSPARFAALWTRLEAALKADGRGLAMEARNFSVVESGMPWHLHTVCLDGHVISCAAQQPFGVETIRLSADELLK